jgi:hypothetical protein
LDLNLVNLEDDNKDLFNFIEAIPSSN